MRKGRISVDASRRVKNTSLARLPSFLLLLLRRPHPSVGWPDCRHLDNLSKEFKRMDLDKSIIQKAKDELQLDEEISSIELIRLLKEHRKRIHPDRFSEEAAKTEATAKFQALGKIIEQLAKFIESERVSRSPRDLALYEPLYDIQSSQDKLEEAEEEIIRLKAQIEAQELRNSNLATQLAEKKSDELRKEREDIERHYRPTGRSLTFLGITALLSAMFAVMTKLESVSDLIKKYSPVPETSINLAIFAIFVAICFVVMKQIIESKLVSMKISDVCSTGFIKGFWRNLEKQDGWSDRKIKDFTESDVFDYLHGKDTKLRKVLSRVGVKMFQINTSERIKNYFVNHLLNKKLIEISYAKELDRTFIIKDGTHRYISY